MSAGVQAMEVLGTLREYEEALLGGGGAAARANSLSLVAHAQQTAEACRLAHPHAEWLQLAGLLQPLGKLLAHPRCAAFTLLRHTSTRVALCKSVAVNYFYVSKKELPPFTLVESCEGSFNARRCILVQGVCRLLSLQLQHSTENDFAAFASIA